VAEQWKRKTILTVKNKFPFATKRMPVVKREEIVLTPIEVSIEAIEQRTERLRGAVKNPDPKFLQPILQGSCAPTVNSGPIEICRAFLPVITQQTSSSGEPRSPSPTPSSSQYPQAQVERLREGVKEFLKACSLGLKVNSKIIGADMGAFQAELIAGFMKLAEEVGPFLGAPARPRSSSAAHKLQTIIPIAEAQA
jgi:hypothetical protein